MLSAQARAGAMPAPRPDPPDTNPGNPRRTSMTRLHVYDPYAGNGIDQLFRGIFAPVRRESDAAPIRIDVTENDLGYVVHAEIPGVKKDDIHVTIEGNTVSIGAEVKRETERKEGERVLRTERYQGSVFRSFVLSSELDESSSEAKYEGGVLELKLAKKPANAGRKLAIQ
jgi:HSP20 family protein